MGLLPAIAWGAKFIHLVLWLYSDIVINLASKPSFPQLLILVGAVWDDPCLGIGNLGDLNRITAHRARKNIDYDRKTHSDCSILEISLPQKSFMPILYDFWDTFYTYKFTRILKNKKLIRKILCSTWWRKPSPLNTFEMNWSKPLAVICNTAMPTIHRVFRGVTKFSLFAKCRTTQVENNSVI